MTEIKKSCSYCGTTKALTKHHVNGGHKGPSVPTCEFCHAVINGASQKSFEKLLKKVKRKVARQQEILALLQEKLQPDGTFLISASLNCVVNTEKEN